MSTLPRFLDSGAQTWCIELYHQIVYLKICCTSISVYWSCVPVFHAGKWWLNFDATQIDFMGFIRNLSGFVSFICI